jgi:hypothetical protein
MHTKSDSSTGTDFFLIRTFVSYRCKICHVTFLFTADNLRNHVRSAHQLPVNEYRDMYLHPGSGPAEPDTQVENLFV